MTTKAKLLLGLGLAAVLLMIVNVPARASGFCFGYPCDECTCRDSCSKECCEDFSYSTCGSSGVCRRQWPCPNCSCTGATTYGTAASEELHGNNGNNCIYGEAGDDAIYGGGGNDKLYGGSGDDDLYGEAGEDCLYGGTGTDYLNGGSGQDGCLQYETFVSCERGDI